MRQAKRVPVTALTITGILLLPLSRLGLSLLFELLMTSEIPDPIEVVLGVLDVALPLGIVVLARFAFLGSRRRGRIEFGVFCIAVFIALLKFAIGLVFLADIGGVGRGSPVFLPGFAVVCVFRVDHRGCRPRPAS